VSVAVYLPLLVCGLLALVARPLAVRLSPGRGAWALTVAAVVGAIGGLWTVGLLVASLVDDVPFLDTGQTPLPVNDVLSMVAAVGLAWCAVRLVREWRRQRQVRHELQLVRALPGDDLVVLPDSRAFAFALPGRRGRVVATDTMLRALTAPQRRVLIAHERAHLRARHPTMLAMVQFAAAANPLLVPVGRAVRFLGERHADEWAAAAVGDRDLVVAALAAAALAAVVHPSAHGATLTPAFERSAVMQRITALRAPQRPRRLALSVAALAIGLVVTATAHATGEFAQLVLAFLPG
jgi:hypothetical protein